MSASRAYEILLRPAVFQPVGLFTFGLIGYIWIDKRLTVMDTSVTKALEKLNSAATTASIPNDLANRLRQLETTLSAPITATDTVPSQPDTFDALTADMTAIKSTSDENMSHIQQTFDGFSAQISALQSTSDANMHGIEQQFASLTSQITQIAADNDTDALNNDISAVKVNVGLLDIAQNQMMNEIGTIKAVTDANFAELSGTGTGTAEASNYRAEIAELRGLTAANTQDMLALTGDINDVKSLTDGNMHDIAGSLLALHGEVNVVKSAVDENMQEIADKFEALTSRVTANDEMDGINAAIHGVKVDIGLIKLMHDKNMDEIEAKLAIAGRGGDVGQDFERLDSEIIGIKAMTDGNMQDIAENLEVLNGEIAVIKATADANMRDVAEEFDVLGCRIKEIEANDESDGVYDAINEVKVDIGLIKLMHDKNMQEIEGKIGVGNWEEISTEIYNINKSISQHYDALVVAETGFNDLEQRQKVMEWDGEERFDKLMEKRTEMDLRLEDMESQLADHRAAFNVAEGVCNELLSWKNEVVATNY